MYLRLISGSFHTLHETNANSRKLYFQSDKIHFQLFFFNWKCFFLFHTMLRKNEVKQVLSRQVILRKLCHHIENSLCGKTMQETRQ